MNIVRDTCYIFLFNVILFMYVNFSFCVNEELKIKKESYENSWY